jgi:hypothetical protein
MPLYHDHTVAITHPFIISVHIIIVTDYGDYKQPYATCFLSKLSFSPFSLYIPVMHAHTSVVLSVHH